MRGGSEPSSSLPPKPKSTSQRGLFGCLRLRALAWPLKSPNFPLVEFRLPIVWHFFDVPNDVPMASDRETHKSMRWPTRDLNAPVASRSGSSCFEAQFAGSSDLRTPTERKQVAQPSLIPHQATSHDVPPDGRITITISSYIGAYRVNPPHV